MITLILITDLELFLKISPHYNGPVENYCDAMRVVAQLQEPEQLQSILSYLVAIPLSSLIFAK